MVSLEHAMEAVHDPLIGQNVGGYIVERPLGEGGNGLVYQARHPILNRRFAVKVLRPEVAGDASVSSNFVREAQTLSSLKHPHIIDIVGFGPLDDRRQYMVMEFLEGKTLEDELIEKGRMSPERALILADQILDALSAAHSVEIVHRDLKPSNVFLSRLSGGTELVKLLDFGLAKMTPQLMTSALVPIGHSIAAGTPEYVAPEQALGMQASQRSDLYSFGVVLFEMLTGDLPFHAKPHEDRIRSLLTMHIHQEAPSISSATEAFAFPYELELLVAELLKKDPADRPPSAEAVRHRLMRLKRALQQQATQQKRNPLLDLPPELLAAKREVEIDQLVRSKFPTEPMFKDLPDPVQRRRPSAKWWSLAALPLLLLLLWNLGGSEPEPVVAAEPVVAEPVVIAEPVVPVEVLPPVHPEPSRGAPPQVESEPELLSALNKRKPAPPPKKQPAPAPEIAPAIEIRKSSCEPDERWRKASRAHLQELQQAAARSTDRTAWARFESTEPVLSAAIAKATTGVECDAVDRDIQQLARKLTP